ncbi:MAG: hypothetical protein JWO95_151 [Verrucomicrobiales bacterium]|nr:hypothetical protein [Verrucomicrobiales bacterium]
MRIITPARIRAARVVAICADAIQIGLPMFFGEGFMSPFQDALDILVCGILTGLVGWHHVFIPTFLVELIPFGDLAPTWTLAAFIATRPARTSSPPPATEQRNPPKHATVIDI